MAASHSTDKTASGNVALDHIEFTPTDAQGAAKHNDDAAMDIEHASTPAVTPDDVQKYSKSDDAAMKAMAEYKGPPLILGETTSRRLLRKIDWHIMPIL